MNERNSTFRLWRYLRLFSVAVLVGSQLIAAEGSVSTEFAVAAYSVSGDEPEADPEDLEITVNVSYIDGIDTGPDARFGRVRLVKVGGGLEYFKSAFDPLPSTFTLTADYIDRTATYALASETIAYGSGGVLDSDVVFIGPWELAPVKRARIQYANTQEYSVTLRIVDEANPAIALSEITIAAGQTVDEVVTLPPGVDSVLLLVRINDISFSDYTWGVEDGAVTDVSIPGSVLTEETETPTLNDIPEPPGLPGGVLPSDIVNLPSTEPRPSVWTDDEDTVAVDALDKSTFREGVDKLDVSTQRSAVYLDSMDSYLREIRDRLQEQEMRNDADREQREEAQGELDDALASATASVTGAVADLGNEMTSVVGTALAGMGPSAWEDPDLALGSLSGLSVDLPPVLVGAGAPASLDLNPMTSDLVPSWVKSMATWLRATLGWVIVVTLAGWIMQEIRKALGIAFLTPHAPASGLERSAASNQVSGAVSFTVRIIAVAAIAAGLIVMPTAFINLYTTEFDVSINGLISAAGAAKSAGGSVLATVFAFADQFVPIATIFSSIVNGAAFNFILLPIQTVWQWIIRHIPL